MDSGTTRDDILGVAAQLILLDGVGAATIYGIGQRAGVSNATVYRLWPTRAALLVDAFGSLFPVPARRPPDGDPDDVLVETILVLADALGGDLGVRFMELQLFLPPSTERWAFIDSVMSPWRGRLLSIWRAGLTRGVFDPGIEESIAVDQLVGSVLAHAFLTPKMDERAAAETLRRRVVAAMNGLRIARSR